MELTKRRTKRRGKNLMDTVFNITYEGKPRGVMVSIIVSSPYPEHNSPEERRAFLEVITKAARGSY